MRQVATPIVLLVEDEALISRLVAAALSERGFIVHEMATADDALRYMHASGGVDVLFTDVNLPGSINGEELALRARELRPELPIVYASGRYRPTDIGALVSRSMFVSKSYDPDDVGMLLIRLTERSH